jgi:predicted dinucleotide-binding enzyme
MTLALLQAFDVKQSFREQPSIDTGNYYPRERDGRIDEIETGMTETRWAANQLGRPVVKAFNATIG